MSADRIRVAVCVPSSGLCRTQFAMSLASLMMCGQVLRSRAEAGGFDITVLSRESSNIPGNREALANSAMQWNCSHVLFIDDDMGFDPNIMELMLSRRVPYVACNYVKRQNPVEFTAALLDKSDQMVTCKTSLAMEEAWYTGLGFALIERQVFEKVPKPWFLPYYVDGEYSTEDNPFCQRVREAGYAVLVDHTASKHIYHIGHAIYSWKDWKQTNILAAEDGTIPQHFEVVSNEKQAA